jgi:hypothetical protein
VAIEPAAKEIQRSEVDGVPVFWAELPGPPLGALIFRTGFADETLPTSGITHLVEHLALRQFSGVKRAAEYNGHVEGLRTVFHAQGSAQDVADFLQGACRAIADLPLDDLEVERRILETEDAGSVTGPVTLHRRLRFGATGHALRYYVQLGLRRLTADDVAEWARERFTAGNAAAFLTFPPPEGLRLPLLDGERILPQPAEEPEPSDEPLRFEGPNGIAALSTVGRTAEAWTLAADLLPERLERTLRHELGVSYEIGGDSDLLDSKHVLDCYWVDFLDEHARDASEAFVEVFHELAETGPDEEELRTSLERIREELDDPGRLFADLDDACTRELNGIQQRPTLELLELDEKRTPDEVAESFRELMRTAVVTLPESAPTPAGYGAPKDHHSTISEGRTYTENKAFYKRGARAQLVVADDGFAWSRGDDGLTIELDHLVAVLRYPDDERLVLIRDCGCEIDFLPELLKDGAQAAKDILARVPDEKIVPMRERATS